MVLLGWVLVLYIHFTLWICHDHYDDDEHAAAALSGAATSPSQQALGGQGGEGLWSAWPKADPQSPVDMPTPGCLRASCRLNCITRRISRTLPFGAGLACMELTRGSARDPDPLNFPCRLVAFFSGCSAARSTAMATWKTTTTSMQTHGYGVVWCGGWYVASYMHVRAARRRDQDGPQLISDMLSVSNCPKSFLQWVCTCRLACVDACIPTYIHTFTRTYMRTAGRDCALRGVGQKKSAPSNEMD